VASSAKAADAMKARVSALAAGRGFCAPFSTMTASDMLEIALFGGIGFWWLLAPRDFIRHYTWLHRPRLRVPSASGVRIAGTVLIALACVIAINAARS
jgi:hypothetical protein